MGRQVVATIAGAVLICAACGAEAPAGSSDAPGPPPPESVAGLPATTLFVRPPVDATRIDSVSPAVGGQPCPVSDGSPDGGDGMFAEMARVEPMLGQVLAYGGERPDQFGSYGLVWHAGDDASVVISFTSDLDVRRAALEAIVAHPDDLIVCQAAVSGEVAQAIAATLVDELDGRFLSIGRGIGPVEVGLAPDEEMLAGELLARYGEAIELTVGALAIRSRTPCRCVLQRRIRIRFRGSRSSCTTSLHP